MNNLIRRPSEDHMSSDLVALLGGNLQKAVRISCSSPVVISPAQKSTDIGLQAYSCPFVATLLNIHNRYTRVWQTSQLGLSKYQCDNCHGGHPSLNTDRQQKKKSHDAKTSQQSCMTIVPCHLPNVWGTFPAQRQLRRTPHASVQQCCQQEPYQIWPREQIKQGHTAS